MSESRRPLGRGPGRSQAKERIWRQHIERQRRSKLTVRGFCAQAGISEPSFYAWRSELTRRDSETGQSAPSESQTSRPTASPKPRFLPVTIAEYPRAAATASQVEVVLPSGLLVRVPAQDTAALRTVLELLEPPPC
jgi:transposase-like protein